MNFEYADRIKKLPPYLFAEIEKITHEKKLQGLDIISLSIGDPDLPPPEIVINSIKKEASDGQNHHYSLSQVEPFFREAVSTWCKKRFGIDLAKDEVISLMGSKEGLVNIARAFVNSGDRVLVPDPAYPVYKNSGAILNDGIVVSIPLLEENKFLPDLEKIDSKRAKMMFLNYPNNPTSAIADKKILRQIVDFAKEKNIILCYDNAYSEICFDGYKAHSILEVDGAKDITVEFHSCSKTFNMTGDRIAFAIGNKHLLQGLTKIKSQVDSGPPVYIQKVATKALESYKNAEFPEFLKKNNAIYSRRRDILVNHLNSMGFKCEKPKATFYVWLNCGCNSLKFASKLLEVGVAITPGIGFGKYGESFVRFSLTQPEQRIE